MGEVQIAYPTAGKARVIKFLRHYGSHVLTDPNAGISIYNLYGTTVAVYEEGKSSTICVNSKDSGLVECVSDVLKEKVLTKLQRRKVVKSGSGCHLGKAVD